MSMLELSIMQDRLEENQEKEEREFQEYFRELEKDIERKIANNEIELEDDPCDYGNG